MEKLPMCRMCLVQNVRMFVVVNRNLRELYEKLTDIPFVTEDSRPILACFICCTKLKQCYQLLRQCLEAEELFSHKSNDNYEHKPEINEGPFGFCSGFIKSPTENISIVDVVQTESFAIKQELPEFYEELDLIEPKEEHQSGELELENLDNSCLDVANLLAHHSESDLEDDVPLMVFKTEVEEEQEVSKKKRRARETTRSNVAKKPKLDTRRTKDAITAEQTSKDKPDSEVNRTTQILTSKPGTSFKEPYKCDQRSISEKSNLTSHIRIHNENPYTCGVCQRKFSLKSHLSDHIRIHTGEYRCDVCQRSFARKSNLTIHVRVIHSGEKPFKCDVCHLSFGVKGQLSQHIRRIHTGLKPYRCFDCQCNFIKKCDLKKHICKQARRTGGYGGVAAGNVRRGGAARAPPRAPPLTPPLTPPRAPPHIRINSCEKPYKCNVCQRSFSQLKSLAAHFGRNCMTKMIVNQVKGVV